VEILSWSADRRQRPGAQFFPLSLARTTGSLVPPMAFFSLIDPLGGWEAAGEIESSASPVLTMDWCTKNLAVGRQDGQ
jgi:hypothetical protein